MSPRIRFAVRLGTLVGAVTGVVAGCREAPTKRFAPPAGRETIHLGGQWEVAAGDLGTTPPADFDRRVPVPGLVSSAEPPFADVGTITAGREAFWYRRRFIGPAQRRGVATLTLHKVKYGAAVWLNGIYLGEHHSAYAAARFDASGTIALGLPNEVLVRVGDAPARLPPDVPAAQDAHKRRWLPGLYDEVTITFSDTPHILRIKVEPDIARSRVRVLTWLRNDSDETREVRLESLILEAALLLPAAAAVTTPPVTLAAGATRRIEQWVDIPGARLWRPSDPFLYTLFSAVRAGDRILDDDATRFGMREVQWRAATATAPAGLFLNGRRLVLRGGTINLHRFFEDPARGTLPWDTAWVRYLLSVYPQRMHWNALRFAMGRAPRRWYQLADELGVIIGDEFMMWPSGDATDAAWSVDRLADEYRAMIEESGNHPSVAWWDVGNEVDTDAAAAALARVRDLDPTRQWEGGGLREPPGTGDPIDDHAYLSDDPASVLPGEPPRTFAAPAHPHLLTEYGGLWLQRDGAPTPASAAIFDALLGPGPHDPLTYREAYAYVVGGLTEFWRAQPRYAGVFHHAYLGGPGTAGGATDSFIDVRSLVLEPRFYAYARYAFAPIGVYLDTWREWYPPTENISATVRLVNDLDRAQTGVASLLAVSPAGEIHTSSLLVPLTIDPYGRGSLYLTIPPPGARQYLLVATFAPDNPRYPTVYSRRKIGYPNLGVPAPDPPYGP